MVLSEILNKQLILEFSLIELKEATSAVLVRHVIPELTLHSICFLNDIIRIKEHQSCTRVQQFALLFDS